LEEGPSFAFKQFDPQPFGGNGYFDLIFNLVEVRDLADGFLQFLLQFRHVVFGDGQGLVTACGKALGVGDLKGHGFPAGP
jgi:hypothetical protein